MISLAYQLFLKANNIVIWVLKNRLMYVRIY